MELDDEWPDRHITREREKRNRKKRGMRMRKERKTIECNLALSLIPFVNI